MSIFFYSLSKYISTITMVLVCPLASYLKTMNQYLRLMPKSYNKIISATARLVDRWVTFSVVFACNIRRNRPSSLDASAVCSFEQKCCNPVCHLKTGQFVLFSVYFIEHSFIYKEMVWLPTRANHSAWFYHNMCVCINARGLKMCPSNENVKYRKISNIRRTKSQNLNVSRLGLHLSLCNIFKPRIKWRMKM